MTDEAKQIAESIAKGWCGKDFPLYDSLAFFIADHIRPLVEEKTTAQQALREMCEAEQQIRELCRPYYIDYINVDGDSYGVPPVADVVEETIKTLIGRIDNEV